MALRDIASTVVGIRDHDPRLVAGLALFKRGDTWRIDLSQIYPPFLLAICGVLVRCQARGAYYYATSGLRSWDVQRDRHERYKKGLGTKAAPPGYSAHQFGAAIDFAADGDVDKPGLQASWRLPAYRILVEEVERSGLVSGSRFNDTPHVQVPVYVSGASMKPLREIYAHGKVLGFDETQALRAIWSYFDEKKLARKFSCSV